MGWIGILINMAAVVFLWNNSSLLFVMAMCSVVASFWSWGIMHNYAVEEANKRPDYTGEFHDLTPEEAATAPDWATKINMASFVLGAVLLLVGLFL